MGNTTTKDGEEGGEVTPGGSERRGSMDHRGRRGSGFTHMESKDGLLARE